MTLDELQEYCLGRLKDISNRNRLTGGTKEHDKNDVRLAAQQALLTINGGVYSTGYTIDSCPSQILVEGTVVELLKQDIMLKARNKITAADGGIILDREGNIDLYIRIKDETERMFRDLVQQHKGYLNLKGAMQ